MPALVINYFGKAAMLLQEPGGHPEPFFHLAPSWAEIPLFQPAAAVPSWPPRSPSRGIAAASRSPSRPSSSASCRACASCTPACATRARSTSLHQLDAALAQCSSPPSAFFGSASRLAGSLRRGGSPSTRLTTTVMTFFVIRFGWKYPLVLACAAATASLPDRRRPPGLQLRSATAAGGWFLLLIGVWLPEPLMLTFGAAGAGCFVRQSCARTPSLPSFLDAVPQSTTRWHVVNLPYRAWHHAHRADAQPQAHTTRCCTSRTSSSPCATT